MLKCRKQRTYHLVSTRQNLRSNTSFEMTYVRDTLLALSICSGSDHPELPQMIQANSDFQYWASPNNLVIHRMIWTQTGLTGLVDRSDRSGPDQCTWAFWSKKWCHGLLFERLSHLKHRFGYIKVTVSFISKISKLENYLWALTKLVNESPHILYWIKCLITKISKILGTD